MPGVDLAQVASLLDLPYDAEPPLPADVLIERLRHALATATRLVGQFPVRNLGDKLPGRDRTIISLANHIVAIADGYLDVASGSPFDAERSAAEPDVLLDRDTLAKHSHTVASRLAATSTEVERPAETFFGTVSLHTVLERTTWHVAQHARQLAMVLTTRGIEPDRPLGADDLDGLPMPAKVWD